MEKLEKIYRKGSNVCIEREGGKMWLNIDTLNNLIRFHERELKSFYEAKRHLTQQCSGLAKSVEKAQVETGEQVVIDNLKKLGF